MHGTPTSSKFRVFGRDDGGNGGLSTSTIIIIAVVCGCVAILALTLFLWRLLARCCRRTEAAVPLPPVQELAHHRRDQQRAAFASTLAAPSRPGTWADASLRTYSGSAASLLTNPEKVSSIYTDEVATAESTLPSPDGEDRLYPPNPSFYRSPDASNSRNTLPDNASSSHSSLVSPSPSTPISENVSTTSHVTTHSRSQSRQVSVTRPSSTRSRSQVQSRGRPLSQASDSPTAHSGFTTRSSSVLRGGPPHRSSTMQIVLPAPLGAQSMYPGEAQTLYANQQISRSSVFADPWLASSNEARNSSIDPSCKSESTSRRRPD